MPARAIIDLSEAPKCYKAIDKYNMKFITCKFRKLDKKRKFNPEWCCLTGTSLLSEDDLDDSALSNCPFHEVPEWTEEDYNNLDIIRHCMADDDSITNALGKLCQLAGMEVEG